MINKINKESRRSKNAAPTLPATRTSGKEPRWTPNKNRTGHKAEPIHTYNTFLNPKFQKWERNLFYICDNIKIN
jgi:hypothetical protein